MTIQLHDAAKSETFTTIASIAGAKAHRVTACTLLEEATTQQFVRNRYVGGEMVPVYKTVILDAGTTLYFHTNCGTARHAGDWRVYENSWNPENEVTCVKCLAKEAALPNAIHTEDITVMGAGQTVTVGPKWTTIRVDGKIVAEISNEHKAQIKAFLSY